MNFRSRGVIAAVALTVPLSLSACGSSTSGAAGDSSSSASAPSASSSSSAPSSSSSSSSAVDASKGTFGAGCAKVPNDGKGSFNGMASDTVATAASNNPLLSTLVVAVKKAGLVDTLNSAPAITVFAPYNGAFDKLGKKTVGAVLANKKLLTTVLTNHVVAGKIGPDKLAGTHKTLSGETIKVSGSGEKFTVKSKKGSGNIICGNVPTANATVYIVDGVLVP
jgi:uncharacterized surface protein with fasciclin (FAS1) repeats